MRDVIKDLGQHYAVDRSMLYATGMSNGAGMTNRVAPELSDTFAAIGPVAGNNWARQSPTSPLSILVVFGRADKLLPLDGGVVKLPWSEVRQPPTRASADNWARLLGCASSGSMRQGPIERTEWTGCRKGSSLAMVVVDDLEHFPAG